MTGNIGYGFVVSGTCVTPPLPG